MFPRLSAAVQPPILYPTEACGAEALPLLIGRPERAGGGAECTRMPPPLEDDTVPSLFDLAVVESSIRAGRGAICLVKLLRTCRMLCLKELALFGAAAGVCGQDGPVGITADALRPCPVSGDGVSSRSVGVTGHTVSSVPQPDRS
ncbi:hypothetical protein P4O66_003162 [Electrophorus voltai]|uniref:Uncharacterized protein n=1 Tax=Electrophorus voltai TaxID=2609070 RepID=A0AAD9DM09_9TELE|nr:hypothetical protein P4O66_003162 [Electrophorus voltai]